MNKIWFDCEFHEDGKTIELISIGMVDGEDNELYLENSEYDKNRATPWLVENVLPKLIGGTFLANRKKIADEILLFVDKNPEFWAYYADYDWVCLCQLYGTMMDLPKTWPMYCRDIKQLCDSVGNPILPDQLCGNHNALDDAIWNKKAYGFLVRK